MLARGEITGVAQPERDDQSIVSMWSVGLAPNARNYGEKVGRAGGFAMRLVWREECLKELPLEVRVNGYW